MHLTTISQSHAVFHKDGIAHRVENLSPGSEFYAHGIQFQTLPDLGKRLSTFATVNDVHFGEVICGSVSGQDMGPVFSAEAGDDPYPEVMNAAAIEEIKAIQPDESEKLIALVASQPLIKGYFSGHTHRNRVRYFSETADVPWVEVACVKDFPGMWAEYQVFEQGIIQVNHRINHPKALEWSEKTKDMYRGSYHDYALGSLSDRCFVVCRT